MRNNAKTAKNAKVQGEKTQKSKAKKHKSQMRINTKVKGEITQKSKAK